MAPMPSIKIDKTDAGFLFSTSADSSPPSSSNNTNLDPTKSVCSSLSDGESYEGYGENEVGCIDAPGHSHILHRKHTPENSSLSTSDDSNNATGGSINMVESAPVNSTPNQDSELDAISRDTWARTSLRRTPISSGRRQISSNALASQLYRSSSFNSSSRSSNCDTTEDMYSDISLDNNVQNLNYKLELLQRQVTDLADTQNIAEDRTTRTKTEYAVLQARYHMLEEQYRESELRSEERLAEEQKRFRELLARVEREASLKSENAQIKLKTIEIEANALRDEVQRLRVITDKQANDLHRNAEKLEIAQEQITVMQQEIDEANHKERKYEQDKRASEEIMIELSKELDKLRSETGPAMPTTSLESIRLEELHQELEDIRQKNRALEEQNEELQAQVLTRGVEEGRHLLNGTMNSLAQELEEMSQAQESVDSATLASLSQLQKAFQEKEEENARLKHYIDTILVNIVDYCPQLLEVKPVQLN